MKKKPFVMLIVLLLAAAMLAACGDDKDEKKDEAETETPQIETGTLEFYANGEDFVRQGFVSKDGWNLSFDQLYITLTDIKAYQTDPPYDAESGGELQANVTVGIEGTHTVDLAAGDADADPILIGTAADAPVGHYNALSWRMVQAPEGEAAGYTLLLIGTAEKDGESIAFTIKLENEYEYVCGEYVGDERKGFVEADATADAEMTFHFDHIFGDADTPPDDSLNTGALGFDPLSALAEDGMLDVDMAGLETALSADDYQMLVDILPTLGHVGEGHCHEVQTG
jgi:hypothetical protein